MSHHPTVDNLFSDAGGFSLGLHAAGCRILAAVDQDARAAATFRANVERLQSPSPLVLGGPDGDLAALDVVTLELPAPVDILIGGPPWRWRRRGLPCWLRHPQRSWYRVPRFRPKLGDWFVNSVFQLS